MKTIINEELIATFLDGNTSPEESSAILRMAEKDENLRNLLYCAVSVDEINELPFGAVAAETNNCGNRCAVMCEQYVLEMLGVERSIDELEQIAMEHGWLKENGVAIENMGCLMENEGMVVKRSFHNNIASLKNAIQDNKHVITMVDAAETCGQCNDDTNGYTPNHAVVVLEVDDENVVFYDPEFEGERRLSHEAFNEAWNDSSGFMVTGQSMKK